MLNCTWDDMEAEMALRKLGVHLDEQQKAEKFYLKLREEYRNRHKSQVATAGEKSAD